MFIKIYNFITIPQTTSCILLTIKDSEEMFRFL